MISGLRATSLPGAVAALLLAALVLGSARSGETQLLRKWFGKKTLAVVLVDVSSSVQSEDWRIYRASYERLVDTLKPADRLVLARISDRSLTGSAIVLDRELLGSTSSLAEEEEFDRQRAQLKEEFDSVKVAGKIMQTRILDALALAQQLFEADRARSRREILLLSDMLEDSEDGRFEREPVGRASVQRVADRRRAKGAVLRLEGVGVWVAGARAQTSGKFFEVREFWLQYLQQAGARIEAGMYVREGLRFE